MNTSLDAGLSAESEQPQLSPADFAFLRKTFLDRSGIDLSPAKLHLVETRLMKRLRARACRDFREYVALLKQNDDLTEFQAVVDLLTTNETYFFREPAHFEYVDSWARESAWAGRTLRVLSAAASSGEEAYSLAMVLADARGFMGWEVVGTDICTSVIERARQGVYPLEATKNIPEGFRTRFCWRGVGDQAGLFKIDPSLRQLVRFEARSLLEPLQDMGDFDLVLLRNCLIYFNQEKRKRIVDNLVGRLRPGGRLIIGHSESLSDVASKLTAEAVSIYKRA